MGEGTLSGQVALVTGGTLGWARSSSGSSWASQAGVKE